MPTPADSNTQASPDPISNMSQNEEHPPSSPDLGTTEKNDPEPRHPREGLEEWRWKATLATMILTSTINGYDVSNVANIQPRLYEAFPEIDLLPWIGLSYSLANFAFLSFARKIAHCFNLRWIILSHMLVFIVGAIVAGSAESMDAVIVGRIIMGWGGSVVQQTNWSYISIFSTPAETAGNFAIMSAMWAVGLVIGGPVGSAFAENQHATWRWAFYLNVPLVGIAFVLGVVCIPMQSLAPDLPVWQRIKKTDPIGVMFNMATPVLFAIATTFSGAIWEWGSGASIAVWVVFGVVLISWIVQQTFSIFTTSEERAFPMHMLPRLDLLPIWIASGCSGAAYAVTLYYVPLFFAFARGYGAMEQTVRLLPFILVFIVIVLMTGAVLPAIGRYKIIYILAGVFTTAGAAAMAATMDSDVSEAQVMGLEALIGIGLGMHFQHGLGISGVINKTPRDKVDSAVICNMVQMGGIAVILSVAGSIFQNVGFNLLSDAIGSEGYTEGQIRGALAGVTSSIWKNGDPAVLGRGIDAVTETIADLFYIVVASGALCLICALLMKNEKLDYGRKKKASAKAEGESA